MLIGNQVWDAAGRGVGEARQCSWPAKLQECLWHTRPVCACVRRAHAWRGAGNRTATIMFSGASGDWRGSVPWQALLNLGKKNDCHPVSQEKNLRNLLLHCGKSQPLQPYNVPWEKEARQLPGSGMPDVGKVVKWSVPLRGCLPLLLKESIHWSSAGDTEVRQASLSEGETARPFLSFPVLSWTDWKTHALPSQVTGPHVWLSRVSKVFGEKNSAQRGLLLSWWGDPCFGRELSLRTEDCKQKNE